MAITVGNRLRHAWNAFMNREKDPEIDFRNIGYSSMIRPDRIRFSAGIERSMVSSIYTRISIDTAAFSILHIKTDKEGNYLETVNSGLNYCLSTEANIDQTGRAFLQDVVESMCDEGAIAIVPVDTTMNPKDTTSYEINSLRTAKILEWYPRHVRVRVYNDLVGRNEELTLRKDFVGIIENPLYSVMNEPNSTLRRLIHKLNLLDIMDNQNSSGKLDLIIQLPYVVKSTARKDQAEKRRKDIEDQLVGSKYGIAYTDGTEKITQLNRPVENNLLKQIEILTSMLYSQLGLSESILDGTASEQELINYYNRTLEPILSAIKDEFNRKFLTKTARTQGHMLKFFNEPFRLVPANNMAEIADKFTRNEILTSNEVRALIGFTPSSDPAADELRNKNLNRSKQGLDVPGEKVEKTEELGKDGENQNGI